MHRSGWKRRGAGPAGAACQPGEPGGEGADQKDIGNEQGLQQEGGPHPPGFFFLPAKPEKGQQGGGKGTGQPSGQIVQKKGHQPVDRQGGPGQAAVPQFQADPVQAEGQENEQQAGQDLGKRDGVRYPGGQPIKPFDSPGDIIAGIVGQEIALKQLRVEPLPHPEELLPNVVVDDIGVGQRLKVGQDKDDAGQDGCQQQVESGGKCRRPRILHGIRFLFQRRGRSCSAGLRRPDHLDPVAQVFGDEGKIGHIAGRVLHQVDVSPQDYGVVQPF